MDSGERMKRFFIAFLFICGLALPVGDARSADVSVEEDGNGCMDDPELPYSCFDMESEVTGVMNATVGCVARESVSNTLDGRYIIVNDTWTSMYPGYKKFCFCKKGPDGETVTVMPCGAVDTDCASGYHWDSNAGCIKDTECNDCYSSGWGRYSDDKEKRADANCNSSTGVCNKTWYYRCAPNYYSATGQSNVINESSLNCTKCPNGGTSSAGSTSVNACTGGSSTPTTPTCTESTTCAGWVNKGAHETRSCTKKSTDCSTYSIPNIIVRRVIILRLVYRQRGLVIVHLGAPVVPR